MKDKMEEEEEEDTYTLYIMMLSNKKVIKFHNKDMHGDTTVYYSYDNIKSKQPSSIAPTETL